MNQAKLWALKKSCSHAVFACCQNFVFMVHTNWMFWNKILACRWAVSNHKRIELGIIVNLWNFSILCFDDGSKQPLDKRFEMITNQTSCPRGVHQEQVSNQLQRTTPVFKSSLSMILFETLCETWELDLGTSNCKTVELPKRFFNTAPWFLFHKVLCEKFFVTINWLQCWTHAEFFVTEFSSVLCQGILFVGFLPF